jgi:hypothetical protein
MKRQSPKTASEKQKRQKPNTMLPISNGVCPFIKTISIALLQNKLLSSLLELCGNECDTLAYTFQSLLTCSKSARALLHENKFWNVLKPEIERYFYRFPPKLTKEQYGRLCIDYPVPRSYIKPKRIKAMAKKKLKVLLFEILFADDNKIPEVASYILQQLLGAKDKVGEFDKFLNIVAKRRNQAISIDDCRYYFGVFPNDLRKHGLVERVGYLSRSRCTAKVNRIAALSMSMYGTVDTLKQCLKCRGTVSNRAIIYDFLEVHLNKNSLKLKPVLIAGVKKHIHMKLLEFPERFDFTKSIQYVVDDHEFTVARALAGVITAATHAVCARAWDYLESKAMYSVRVQVQGIILDAVKTEVYLRGLDYDQPAMNHYWSSAATVFIESLKRRIGNIETKIDQPVGKGLVCTKDYVEYELNRAMSSSDDSYVRTLLINFRTEQARQRIRFHHLLVQCIMERPNQQLTGTIVPSPPGSASVPEWYSVEDFDCSTATTLPELEWLRSRFPITLPELTHLNVAEELRQIPNIMALPASTWAANYTLKDKLLGRLRHEINTAFQSTITTITLRIERQGFRRMANAPMGVIHFPSLPTHIKAVRKDDILARCKDYCEMLVSFRLISQMYEEARHQPFYTNSILPSSKTWFGSPKTIYYNDDGVARTFETIRVHLKQFMMAKIAATSAEFREGLPSDKYRTHFDQFIDRAVTDNVRGILHQATLIPFALPFPMRILNSIVITEAWGAQVAKKIDEWEMPFDALLRSLESEDHVERAVGARAEELIKQRFTDSHLMADLDEVDADAKPTVAGIFNGMRNFLEKIAKVDRICGKHEEVRDAMNSSHLISIGGVE